MRKLRWFFGMNAVIERKLYGDKVEGYLLCLPAPFHDGPRVGGGSYESTLALAKKLMLRVEGCRSPEEEAKELEEFGMRYKPPGEIAEEADFEAIVKYAKEVGLLEELND